jgi:hypothetical protein
VIVIVMLAVLSLLLFLCALEIGSILMRQRRVLNRTSDSRPNTQDSACLCLLRRLMLHPGT